MSKIQRSSAPTVSLRGILDQQPAGQTRSTGQAGQSAATQSTGWKAGAGAGKKFQDAFHRSPYTNADAGVVKQQLGLKSLDAAKQHIGKAILTGKESELQGMGVTRDLWDRQDCMTAFKRSGYTDADVKEAMRRFDFLKGGTVDEAKEYIGLKIRNKYESMLQEVGITRLPYDDHEMIPLAKKAGYTEADAKKAIKAFDFLQGSSVREAMGYIGLKVANNYEEMLRDAGITPSKKKAAE
jgi:hypothetical protein